MYLFDELAKQAKTVSFKTSLEARKWYYDQAMKMEKSIDPETVMKSAKPFRTFDKDDMNSSSMIGKMYMYIYDPKWKKKLPFWDTFPLVFPIEFYPNGFLGINLHYLPPMQRVYLMRALHSIANNKKYNNTTKLVISYQTLKQSAMKFRGFEECVKRYLFSHVRSGFQIVTPADWDKALLLPMQKWVTNPNDKIAKRPPY